MKAEIISVFIMSLLTAYGHLAIKHSSSHIFISRNPLLLMKQFLNPFILSGISAVLAAPLFYFYALKTLNLNTAYSFTAINHILIPLLSIILFRERITVKKASAVIMITAGVFIWNL